MEKKLIAFDDDLLEKLKDFSERYKKTFTESVRILIQLGLKTQYEDEPNSDDLFDKLKAMEKKVEEMSWWSADEGSSKLHNIEVAIEEIEKKLNILTAASKHFKGHIEDRSIHLQD